MLVAVGHAVERSTARPRRTAAGRSRCREVGVGPAGLRLQARRTARCPAPGCIGPAQCRPARRGAGLGVERVAEHLGQAERLGQSPAPAGPVRSPARAAPFQHPLAGEIGVRPGQLGARAERLEDRRRAASAAAIASAPRHRRHMRARQPAQWCRPRAAGRRPPATAPARARRRRSASAHRSTSDSSSGQPVVQPGDRRWFGAGGEAQGPLVLGGRLTVRGQFGRPARRPRRVVKHRRASPAASAWKASRASSSHAGWPQRGQDPAVDHRAAVRRRSPAPPPAGRSRGGTAAPPPSCGQQAGRQQLVDAPAAGRPSPLQQLQLDPGAGQRRRRPAPRALPLSRAARASTASRADGGTSLDARPAAPR